MLKHLALKSLSRTQRQHIGSATFHFSELLNDLTRGKTKDTNTTQKLLESKFLHLITQQEKMDLQFVPHGAQHSESTKQIAEKILTQLHEKGLLADINVPNSYKSNPKELFRLLKIGCGIATLCHDFGYRDPAIKDKQLPKAAHAIIGAKDFHIYIAPDLEQLFEKCLGDKLLANVLIRSITQAIAYHNADKIEPNATGSYLIQLPFCKLATNNPIEAQRHLIEQYPEFKTQISYQKLDTNLSGRFYDKKHLLIIPQRNLANRTDISGFIESMTRLADNLDSTGDRLKNLHLEEIQTELERLHSTTEKDNGCCMKDSQKYNIGIWLTNITISIKENSSLNVQITENEEHVKQLLEAIDHKPKALMVKSEFEKDATLSVLDLYPLRLEDALSKITPLLGLTVKVEWKGATNILSPYLKQEALAN